jgi:hypothetical protein
MSLNVCEGRIYAVHNILSSAQQQALHGAQIQLASPSSSTMAVWQQMHLEASESMSWNTSWSIP